jgi:hypothetical protein
MTDVDDASLHRSITFQDMRLHGVEAMTMTTMTAMAMKMVAAAGVGVTSTEENDQRNA